MVLIFLFGIINKSYKITNNNIFFNVGKVEEPGHFFVAIFSQSLLIFPAARQCIRTNTSVFLEIKCCVL